MRKAGYLEFEMNLCESVAIDDRDRAASVAERASGGYEKLLRK